MPCPNGQTCSGDQCSGACTDACAEGQNRCSGTELQTCTRLPNGCLGFGMPTACGPGQICDPSSNQCVSQCGVGECQPNETRCFMRSVQQCGQDLMGCSIWTRIDPCPQGMACPAGGTQCEAVCQPQCALNERRCGNAGYQVCELDATGCEVWSADKQCEPGTQCQGVGQCIESCADGYTETRQCGDCGSQERLCMGGQWTAWTACSGAGQPDDQRACNDCGNQLRQCLPNGEWGPWNECQGIPANDRMCDPDGFGQCEPDGRCIYFA